jgi:CDP-diacylglycerol--glycerol-3-phosphate 3-phosphatidyltransferase
MYYLPFILILSRGLIGLTILFGLKNSFIRLHFLPIFVTGASFDILDGIICRIYGGSHYPLIIGKLDSYADFVFYLSVFVFLLVYHKNSIDKLKYFLFGILILQIISWIYSLIKFGSLTSYHPYSAKAWGVLMIAGIIELCLINKKRILFIMCIVGAICVCEEIAITFILPHKQTNVESIFKAIQIQHEISPALKHSKGPFPLEK